MLGTDQKPVLRSRMAGHQVPGADLRVDAVRVGYGRARTTCSSEADNSGVWQGRCPSPKEKSGLARTILRYEGSGENLTATGGNRHQKRWTASCLPIENCAPRVENHSLRVTRTVRSTSRWRAGTGNYVWAINDQIYPGADHPEVREGEWLRLNLQNGSMMAHPMHLHGHFLPGRQWHGSGIFQRTQ